MGNTVKCKVKEIKDHIKMQTYEMESEDYVAVLREIGEWAMSSADIEEYGVDGADLYCEDE